MPITVTHTTFSMPWTGPHVCVAISTCLTGQPCISWWAVTMFNKVCHRSSPSSNCCLHDSIYQAVEAGKKDNSVTSGIITAVNIMITVLILTRNCRLQNLMNFPGSGTEQQCSITYTMLKHQCHAQY